jgi:hypothetical protein
MTSSSGSIGGLGRKRRAVAKLGRDIGNFNKLLSEIFATKQAQ